MQTFTNQHQITAINRLTYSGTPKVGTRAATGKTYSGYIRPLSVNDAAINNLQWGTGYTLIVEIGTDILPGDQVVIDSITYTVRGRSDFARNNRTSYLKFLVVKGEA